jgi:hypothetical protein
MQWPTPCPNMNFCAVCAMVYKNKVANYEENKDGIKTLADIPYPNEAVTVAMTRLGWIGPVCFDDILEHNDEAFQKRKEQIEAQIRKARWDR